VLLVGQFAILAVPLAMGLLVSARGLRRPEVISAVALRSGFGVLVGLTLVWLFGLSGSGAAIAIIGSAAPIGFTAVVLSCARGLDLDLAASAAAISVFLVRSGSRWRCFSFRVESRRGADVRVGAHVHGEFRNPRGTGRSRRRIPVRQLWQRSSGLIEAIAEARAENRPCPKVITAPTEMVAMSAAHGFAQARGRAQAVLVHVDCGTQALGGAVHNAAKGRAPVLIIAACRPRRRKAKPAAAAMNSSSGSRTCPTNVAWCVATCVTRTKYAWARTPSRSCTARCSSRTARRVAGVHRGGPARYWRAKYRASRIDSNQWQPVAPGALSADQVRRISVRWPAPSIRWW
jgi:hypothetical protein